MNQNSGMKKLNSKRIAMMVLFAIICIAIAAACTASGVLARYIKNDSHIEQAIVGAFRFSSNALLPVDSEGDEVQVHYVEGNQVTFTVDNSDGLTHTAGDLVYTLSATDGGTLTTEATANANGAYTLNSANPTGTHTLTVTSVPCTVTVTATSSSPFEKTLKATFEFVEEKPTLYQIDSEGNLVRLTVFTGSKWNSVDEIDVTMPKFLIPDRNNLNFEGLLVNMQPNGEYVFDFINTGDALPSKKLTALTAEENKYTISLSYSQYTLAVTEDVFMTKDTTVDLANYFTLTHKVDETATKIEPVAVALTSTNTDVVSVVSDSLVNTGKEGYAQVRVAVTTQDDIILTKKMNVTVAENSLTIDDVTAYANYQVKVPATFALLVEDLSYDFNSNAFSITDDDVIVVNSETPFPVTVTATTAGGMQATFKVTTKNAYDSPSPIDNQNKDVGFAISYADRKAKLDEHVDPETPLAMFAGDSFFDERWFMKFGAQETPFYDKYKQDNPNELEKDGYFKGQNVVTAGVSSSTTYDWNVWADTLIYPYNPHALVLHVGTNDLWDCKDDATTVANNVIALIDKLHYNLPETKIYWYSIELRGYVIGGKDQTATATAVQAVNRALKSYLDAVDWGFYLDSYSKMTNTGASPNTIISGNFSDNTHPTAISYENVYMPLLLANGLNCFSARYAKDYELPEMTFVRSTDETLREDWNQSISHTASGNVHTLKISSSSSAQGSFLRAFMYDTVNQAYYNGPFIMQGTLTRTQIAESYSHVEFTLMDKPAHNWYESGNTRRLGVVYGEYDSNNPKAAFLMGYGAGSKYPNSERNNYLWGTVGDEADTFSFTVAVFYNYAYFTFGGVTKSVPAQDLFFGVGVQGCSINATFTLEYATDAEIANKAEFNFTPNPDSAEEKYSNTRRINLGVYENAVINGKIDIQDALTNAHMRVEMLGNHTGFLLIKGTDGKFGISASEYNPAFWNAVTGVYPFTQGSTLMLYFKIIISGNNAYFFVGENEDTMSLSAIYKDCPATEPFKLYFESMACRVYDLELIERDKNPALYNNELAVHATDLAKADGLANPYPELGKIYLINGDSNTSAMGFVGATVNATVKGLKLGAWETLPDGYNVTLTETAITPPRKDPITVSGTVSGGKLKINSGLYTGTYTLTATKSGSPNYNAYGTLTITDANPYYTDDICALIIVDDNNRTFTSSNTPQDAGHTFEANKGKATMSGSSISFRTTNSYDQVIASIWAKKTNSDLGWGRHGIWLRYAVPTTTTDATTGATTTSTTYKWAGIGINYKGEISWQVGWMKDGDTTHGTAYDGFAKNGGTPTKAEQIKTLSGAQLTAFNDENRTGTGVWLSLMRKGDTIYVLVDGVHVDSKTIAGTADYKVNAGFWGWDPMRGNPANGTTINKDGETVPKYDIPNTVTVSVTDKFGVEIDANVTGKRLGKTIILPDGYTVAFKSGNTTVASGVIENGRLKIPATAGIYGTYNVTATKEGYETYTGSATLQNATAYTITLEWSGMELSQLGWANKSHDFSALNTEGKIIQKGVTDDGDSINATTIDTYDDVAVSININNDRTTGVIVQFEERGLNDSGTEKFYWVSLAYEEGVISWRKWQSQSVAFPYENTISIPLSSTAQAVVNEVAAGSRTAKMTLVRKGNQCYAYLEGELLSTTDTTILTLGNAFADDKVKAGIWCAGKTGDTVDGIMVTNFAPTSLTANASYWNGSTLNKVPDGLTATVTPVGYAAAPNSTVASATVTGGKIKVPELLVDGTYELSVTIDDVRYYKTVDIIAGENIIDVTLWSNSLTAAGAYYDGVGNYTADHTQEHQFNKDGTVTVTNGAYFHVITEQAYTKDEEVKVTLIAKQEDCDGWACGGVWIKFEDGKYAIFGTENYTGRYAYWRCAWSSDWSKTIFGSNGSYRPSTHSYAFNAEETAAWESSEGVEISIIRRGNTLIAMIGDREVGTVSLTGDLKQYADDAIQVGAWCYDSTTKDSTYEVIVYHP